MNPELLSKESYDYPNSNFNSYPVSKHKRMITKDMQQADISLHLNIIFRVQVSFSSIWYFSQEDSTCWQGFSFALLSQV